MNVNFGIMESLPLKIRDKRKRNYETAMRALDNLKEYVSRYLEK
ncbi:tRNA:m(5)U-54 MTase gid [Acetivibrio straminisolvens JCM 21531]|uniref:tRNA:m(5)U-54 MTase gid n=2 Tax=Acetivibrio straminisolvens TaxID=253314 RepID=W4V827_9FIRM|nr:tRNA:m(5)U-54 MTase gid [Acetivibrio straminisolvens JCM 21531]